MILLNITSKMQFISIHLQIVKSEIEKRKNDKIVAN